MGFQSATIANNLHHLRANADNAFVENERFFNSEDGLVAASECICFAHGERRSKFIFATTFLFVVGVGDGNASSASYSASSIVVGLGDRLGLFLLFSCPKFLFSIASSSLFE